MAKVFKSIWFKCIVVLLSIALVAGGLLAILNQVLYVSDEERTMRAIKKIYGEEKQFSVLLDSEVESRGEKAWTYLDGDEVISEITKIYLVGDKNAKSYDLLFKSTGGQGFKNGTVTLWIKVIYTVETDNYDIDTVVLDSFEKQTFMGKLGGEYYGGFGKLNDVTEAYENQELWFTADVKDSGAVNKNPVSGATKSATAGCNAANGVIKCIGEKGWEKK